jgi:hypothetical protein
VRSARELHASTLGTRDNPDERAKSMVATSLAVARCAGPAVGKGMLIINSLPLAKVMARSLLKGPVEDE